jgi:hypothetical protein
LGRQRAVANTPRSEPEKRLHQQPHGSPTEVVDEATCEKPSDRVAGGDLGISPSPLAALGVHRLDRRLPAATCSLRITPMRLW